jgi:S1-C subfamily serine protease
MKKLIIFCLIVLMLPVLVAPFGCQQSTPDVVEVIAIFPAESGAPPPTGAWAYDRKIDPHPERIQRVFNLGDRMYLGLRISERLETDITFSRYTLFNRDTGEEVEAGLPGDLGPFEPGRATLAGFQNPWILPADPGNYELRVYVDNTVIASARFEVSTKVTRQPVVMVKSQLTGGRSGQSSGFIFRSSGEVLTFLADASEIEHLEVVLGNGLPLEASASRTDNTASLACIKIEANNYLVPFTLASNNEVAGLKTGTHLVAMGYSDGEYREIEVEVLDTKHDLPLPLGTTLRVIKLNRGGEPGMAGGPVVNDAGHVVGGNAGT